MIMLLYMFAYDSPFNFEPLYLLKQKYTLFVFYFDLLRTKKYLEQKFFFCKIENFYK